MNRSGIVWVPLGLLTVAACAVDESTDWEAQDPEDADRIVTIGEHAPRPSEAEMERLRALYDHEPVFELSGDISGVAVTYSVDVKLVLDDEWRAYYGGNAVTVANNAIEAADDAMFNQFGINLWYYKVVEWDTAPDGARSCGSLLNELRDDTSVAWDRDIIIAFSKTAVARESNGFLAAGCAELGGDNALIRWDSTHYDRWTVTQHEVSHLFGVPDRYPDYNGAHPDDVMERQWEAPNKWCTATGFNDKGIMNANKAKFE